MNKVNINDNVFSEKIWEIKLNELLKDLLGDKIEISVVEYIDDVAVVDDEGERQGHDENTEIVYGTYKGRPFQVDFKRDEKKLAITYDACYKNIFKNMTPVLSRIVGASPICEHYEMPVPRMPVKYVLTFDALCPDFTLRNLIRREQMREIYDVIPLNGKRKELYRDNVKLSILTNEFAR